MTRKACEIFKRWMGHYGKIGYGTLKERDCRSDCQRRMIQALTKSERALAECEKGKLASAVNNLVEAERLSCQGIHMRRRGR